MCWFDGHEGCAVSFESSFGGFPSAPLELNLTACAAVQSVCGF
jgi:hypothetical protein